MGNILPASNANTVPLQISTGQLVQICGKPEWFRVRHIRTGPARMTLGHFVGTVPLASVTAVRND